MIRIKLNKRIRAEIEGIFWNDAENAETGIVKTLKKNEIYLTLRNYYPVLYDYFYNSNGALDEGGVKKLLLANRKEMEFYIEKFGDFRIVNKGLLDDIFLYKAFCRRKAAYDILRLLDVSVCPYCNRNYIMTLDKSKVRPQFDHYFPKSKYPFLALSLYNLIPSCNICNEAKSYIDTKKYPFLYPYEDEFGDKIVFTTECKDNSFTKVAMGISDEFEVVIHNKENVLQDEVKNQIERLHITELYNEHKDYIMDIYKSYHINTKERIEELLNQFPNLFSSEEDVRSLMFMSDIKKENWGKRPLAKLSHDIYNELEKIKYYS